MTEGIDIPRVSTIVLDRDCDSVTPYMQTTGRSLRPFPGKTRALLIDLHGVSHRFGAPTLDRAWSLAGKPPVDGGEHGGEWSRPAEPETLCVELRRYEPAEIGPVHEQVVAPAKPERPTRRQLWDALAHEVDSGRMRMADAIVAYRRGAKAA
jgi:superfamily II DNA or RNA helicase